MLWRRAGRSWRSAGRTSGEDVLDGEVFDRGRAGRFGCEGVDLAGGRFVGDVHVAGRGVEREAGGGDSLRWAFARSSRSAGRRGRRRRRSWRARTGRRRCAGGRLSHRRRGRWCSRRRALRSARAASAGRPGRGPALRSRSAGRRGAGSRSSFVGEVEVPARAGGEAGPRFAGEQFGSQRQSATSSASCRGGRIDCSSS